jgi:actin-like ATPase involved in cell morphogenesis
LYLTALVNYTKVERDCQPVYPHVERGADMRSYATEIIGFDLGHGETAIAKVALDKNAEPEMLELHGRKTQITAIGRHPQKGILIGEAAFRTPGVTVFEVGFKQGPKEDEHYRQTIKTFVEECNRLLITSNQVRGGESSHFFIGCPSGWSEGDRRKYEQVLKASGIPLLTVVRESRAALLHVIENGELTRNDLQASVLIIDIGSSTTDFTLVNNVTSEEPLDFGTSLGASLIEKVILGRTLQHHEKGTELGELFGNHPAIRSRCELICRKAKEEYFSNESMYEDTEAEVQVGFENVQNQFLFVPQVNGPSMHEVLNHPVPQLDHKGWVAAFHHVMTDVRSELERTGRLPRTLVLTGGGSRMKFIAQICEEVFPDANLIRGSEPEFSIARGLSHWGRVYLRTAGFEVEIEELSKAVPGVVKDHLSTLIDNLVELLTATLVEEAIKPGLRAWRDGKVRRLNELEPHIKRIAESKLRSSTVTRRIAETCAKWFAPIQKELNDRIEVICRKYGIPTAALTFNIDIKATRAIPEIDVDNPFEGQLDLGTGIVAIIIAMLSGGGGFALLVSGPLGLVLGFIIGLCVAVIGRGKAEEVIKGADLPDFIRGWVLSDKKIETSFEEKDEDLKEQVREKLVEGGVFDKVTEEVNQQLKRELQERADEARLLIR